MVGSFSLSHHSQNWRTANRGNRAKGVSEWPYINARAMTDKRQIVTRLFQTKEGMTGWVKR